MPTVWIRTENGEDEVDVKVTGRVQTYLDEPGSTIEALLDDAVRRVRAAWNTTPNDEEGPE